MKGRGVLIDKEITLNTKVRIKYLKTGKEITIQIVGQRVKGIEIVDGIQRVNINSPLALSLRGKSAGGKVKIGNTMNYIEILEIYN